MLNLGPLAFLSPWLLTALAVLPVLWWLLRVTPPAPRVTTFPALRLLIGLIPKEETPAHTPLWLLILRMVLATLLILALAEPVLNPRAPLKGDGPLVIVVDDGWAAGTRWEARVAEVNALLDQAERRQRPVVLMGTAPPADGEAIGPSKLMTAGEARAQIAAWQPKPWATDRAASMKSLADLRWPQTGDAALISDGLDDGAVYGLAERLQWFGALHVVTTPAAALPIAMMAPQSQVQGLKVMAQRATEGQAATTWVRGLTDQGDVLARDSLTFAAGARMAERMIELPAELRNRLSRIEIESEASAAAVMLLDERWRRRPVGLVSGAALEGRQPLLSDIYYLERALTPFTDVRQGTIAAMLQRELAVLILADIGQVVGPERANLEKWIDQGGVLVRFAGPRVAEQTDNLMPVRVRRGSRQLGGAMSWSEPARLAPFTDNSPFFGLAPAAEVTVSQQVLAEPDLELGAKTWARLVDGTPLVTGERRGKGWLVLVHTTANTRWSNLALSGLYVDILRRLVDMSQGVQGSEGDGLLAPYALLDGFGRLGGGAAATNRAGAPSGGGSSATAARAILARTIATAVPGPRQPPGFYGNENARRAVNLGSTLPALKAIAAWPDGTIRRGLGDRRETPLMPWLLAAAIVLALADLVISYGLRGLLRRRLPAASAALALALLTAMPATAQVNKDDFALKASLDLRLAYVVTGEADVDEMSRAGLLGLSDVLSRRTSVEPRDPMGVNLERDEILFFPLLYWPITPQQREIGDKALAKVDAFMKSGGLILFDTRDQELGGFGGARLGASSQQLRRLLGRLDVPPLIPVPADHVLTKTFYLLQEFPGRYTGGQVWVERNPGGGSDGVSGMVIGAHDWAAAWAIDNDGRPLAALVPGGARQREFAYRFGVNLVMYTLTGNYKSDQVHIPALLERLGQ